MKIRNGFVSNSSSSSFCLFGIVVGLEDFKDEVKTLIEEEYGDYFSEYFEKSLPKELDYAEGLDNISGTVIGIGPNGIDENRTLKDVKKDLMEKINSSNMFKKEYTTDEICFHHDGGYDG